MLGYNYDVLKFGNMIINIDLNYFYIFYLGLGLIEMLLLNKGSVFL